ncbi:MAG: MlaD family protein [Verrucomicrobia bacterium]|nr:MlaD family protein [Verrucomicrobiota bacterium]
MAVIRNELRTGLLVAITAAVLAAALIYLEAPGLAGERRIFRIYFDNAGGINAGAPVMLAGRKIGQVSRLLSPVPESQRPRPDLAVIVEVAVDRNALIYRRERVLMLQYSLLGEQVIDFTQGNEASGRATADTSFIGEREPGLADVGQKMLEKMDPVLSNATLAMQGLQKTTEHLTELTEEGSDLVAALANFRELGDQLLVLTGTDGAFQQTFDNLKALTGKQSPLANALNNAEQFTGELAENKDIGVSLRNFRHASENLKRTARGLRNSVGSVGPGIQQTVHNAEQFTDTVKHQPWRLIWPSTKKYPEDKPKPCSSPTPCRNGR